MNSLPLFDSLLAGLIVAILVISIGILGKRISSENATHALRQRLERYSGPRAKPINPTLRSFADNLKKRSYLFFGGVISEKRRARLLRRLGAAGKFDENAVDRFATYKAAFGLGGLLLGIIFAFTWGGFWLPLIFVLAISGFFIPDLWLYDRGVNRSQAIGYELPEVIDLMYLSVSAGMSLNSAMQKVVESQHGPASAELTRVLEEMRLGISRSDAFKSMVERIKQPDLVRFAEAMIKIDQLGISLTNILGEQAREMRMRRRALAREKAQRISVQILLPLIFCFLPGLFIIVLGPAVASIFNLFAN